MRLNILVIFCLTANIFQVTISTPCNATRSEQRRTGNSTALGYFEVKCVEGDETRYEKKQCWASTGRCWCVDEVSGERIPRSHVNPGQELDCGTFGWCTSRNKELSAILGDAPMPGRPAPKCNDKGNFVASQFYPSTGEKYCVIPDGREIAGTRTGPTEKAFDCDNLPPCLQQEASVTHLQVAGLFPLGLRRPKCDGEGKFERLQCYASTGECWCANPDDGTEIEGTKKSPGEGFPDCAKEEVKVLMSDGGNMTACLKLRKEQLAKVEELPKTQENPMMFVGYYVVTCDGEGNFIPEQCHPSTGHCWCVDKNGNEVPGSLSPPGTPRVPCIEIEVPCSNEKKRKEDQHKNLNMIGMYVPQCEDNGQYKLKQCWPSTGQCWCVSRTGKTIPYTHRGAAENPTQLDCTGRVPPPIKLEDEGENKVADTAKEVAEGPKESKALGSQKNEEEESEGTTKIGVPAYMIIIIAVLVCVLAFVVIGALIYVKKKRDSGSHYVGVADENNAI